MENKFTKGGDPVGTCLQGEIDCSYSELVSVFGEPDGNDGYKVDAEWVLTFTRPDGSKAVATIYNYKNGKNYLGDEGFETSEIRDWHIGGTSPEVVQYVKDVLASAESEAIKKQRDDLLEAAMLGLRAVECLGRQAKKNDNPVLVNKFGADAEMIRAAIACATRRA